MAKRKKRGFTIIEVIIAIAIFAIAATSISIAINTASNMYKRENIRLQTISAADSIIHQLKAKGVGNYLDSELDKNKYDPNKYDSNGIVKSLEDFYIIYNSDEDGYKDNEKPDDYRYIYFNYEDNDDKTNDLMQILSDKSKLVYMDKDDYGKGFGNYKTYSGSKKFVAAIHINRSHGNKNDDDNPNGDILNKDWYYNVYTINVKVWNLDSDLNLREKQAESLASEATTSVSSRVK